MKKSLAVKLIFLTIIIVAIASVSIIFGGYYNKVTNPVFVYKKITTIGLTKIINSNAETQTNESNTKTEKTNYFANITGKTNWLNDENGSQSLDDINLIFNLQVDNENKKYVLSNITNYSGEKILNAKFFVDMKKKKMYIYAMEMLDKYIEIDSSLWLNDTFVNMSKSEKVVVVDAKTLTEILEKRIDTLITENMCKKDGNSYILETTYNELYSKIIALLEELKYDDAFLDCFANRNVVINNIELAIANFELMKAEDGKLLIQIYTEGLIPTINKVSIVSTSNAMKSEIVLEGLNNTKKTIKVVKNGVETLDGTVKVESKGDENKWEVKMDFENNKTLDVTATTKVTKIDKVDEVIESKVTTVDQLTKAEIIGIGLNIKHPFIYKQIISIMGISASNLTGVSGVKIGL